MDGRWPGRTQIATAEGAGIRPGAPTMVELVPAQASSAGAELRRTGAYCRRSGSITMRTATLEHQAAKRIVARGRHNMKLHSRELLVGLALMLVCGTAQARDVPKSEGPANAATRRVHDEANRILESIRSTEYRHKTDIDENKGSYYCDCSGFVGYVLNRTVAKEDGKGPFHDGRQRPLAMDYEKGFAKAPMKDEGRAGWQRIVRLVDARPGDLIAWRHEKPKPGNTGHVVIVDQKPVVEEDGLVRVAIIDSTTLPSSDLKGKGKSGIGRRTMWFTVDKEGQPVGSVRGSRTAKPKVEAISVGRALPAPLKQASTKRAA
jgi:hypothetical protein